MQQKSIVLITIGLAISFLGLSLILTGTYLIQTTALSNDDLLITTDPQEQKAAYLKIIEYREKIQLGCDLELYGSIMSMCGFSIFIIGFKMRSKKDERHI